MACMRIPLGFYQKSVECSWKVVDAFSWLRRGPSAGSRVGSRGVL